MGIMGGKSKISSRPLVCVVGARPNFMKVAPIVRAFESGAPEVPVRLVHTGQHYDAAMKESFFEQLRIPRPDMDLGVGSGSHAVQTAEIMRRFEPVVDREEPLAVLVVGDVNSTLACALVSVKKDIPVIHVEAGLRSGDRSMPEEINRIVTDQLSELLFTTERAAAENLAREGIAESKIRFVGNVMIDTLLEHRARATPPVETLRKYAHAKSRGGYEERFVVLTLHRPSNVDDPRTLRALLDVIAEISRDIPVLFPMHPRTVHALGSSGLQAVLEAMDRIVPLPPVAYLEMLGLMSDATAVLTDSGGMQEECTALGVPCVTLRENTERPITIREGTNTLVGRDPEKILACVSDILRTGGKSGRIPEKWDGKAAPRIRNEIMEWARHAGPLACSARS